MQKQDGYEFNPEDIPSINTHLLIEILANQRLIISYLLSEKTPERAKDMHEQSKQMLKEYRIETLEQVYAQFGRNPLGDDPL